MSSYTVPLPTTDEPGQVLGVYHCIMTALGLELGNRYEDHCRPLLGDNWFANMQAQHQSKISLYDPSFVLNEPLHNPSSPFRDCLPRSAKLYNLMDDVVQIRNLWNHYGAEQTLASLDAALIPIHKLATLAQMSLGGTVSVVRKRIKAIVSGAYPPAVQDGAPATPVEDVVPTATVVSDDEKARLDDDKERFLEEAPTRPPIGSLWLGDVPVARGRMTATRDLIDPSTGISYRGRMADAQTKLARWAALRPMGDLFVADDGAVAGYMSGKLRLIGFLGVEPETSGARGFVLPHLYAVSGGDVIDRDSGLKLSSANPSASPTFTRPLSDGTLIRLTTEGDLAVFGEDDVEKVGHVLPVDWFPGHLPA
jgi:hypothetical protein